MKRACVFVLKFQFLPLFFVLQGWESLVLPHPESPCPGRVDGFLRCFPCLNALRIITVHMEKPLPMAQQPAGDACSSSSFIFFSFKPL